MNRNEFLQKLEYSLTSLPNEEKQDILYDYEEHFSMGLELGKTEEEISESLGDPTVIAKDFKVNYMVVQAENSTSTGNILRAVFATVSLGFFNLIFVLGPFLAAIGIILALFITGIALTGSGVVVMGVIIFQAVFPNSLALSSVMILDGIGAFFVGVGITCLGLLILIGTVYVIKYFYQLTIRYLRFNFRIITDRRIKNEG